MYVENVYIYIYIKNINWSWNCCGLGNPQTVQRFKDLQKKNSPDIIFFQETKNPDDFVLKETEELNFDSHFLVSAHGHGAGGLALFWRKDLNLQVLSSSQNHIDTKIAYKNLTFYSTFVYGTPKIPKRLEVWNMLTSIANTRDGEACTGRLQRNNKKFREIRG